MTGPLRSFFPVLFLTALAAAQEAEHPPRPYLEAARAAAAWIDGLAVKTEHGKAWPADAAEPTRVERTLYSGTPGVVLFLLELARATDDEAVRASAIQGAEDLAAEIENIAQQGCGLYTGVAGVGYVLHRVALATGDARHAAAAKRCVDVIAAAAKRDSPDAAAVHWDGVTDVVAGAAGTGLFLLYAAREMKDERALELARAAGEGLLAVAEPVELAGGAKGVSWRLSPGYERSMPNFSHGTAGLAFFLARLHSELLAAGKETDGRYLAAAEAGARALLAIADKSGDGLRILHHAPGGEDLFYLGWCHGPVGTARLWRALELASGDKTWRGWTERAAHTLRTSGLPAGRTPGYWENVAPCCGAAGVGGFFLDLWARDHEASDLELAQAFGADVRARASVTDLGSAHGLQLSWPQAEHRVRPEFVRTQTGYMQGAAGVGLFFLALDAAEQGRVLDLHWPDALP